MSKLYVVIFFAVLLSFEAGQAAIDCGVSAFQTKAVFKFPGQGYWMQAAGACRITYTGVGGMKSHLYNTCTQKSEPITNHWDATAIPGSDGELYVHGENILTFYKMKDALTQGEGAKPFYTDSKMNGDYQSVGLLRKTRNRIRIRVIMAAEGIKFQDYDINKQGDNFDVIPLHPEPQIYCKNLRDAGRAPQIPIISRNGQMISSQNPKTLVTEIYRLNSTTGNCTFVAKTPLKTDKVSFSYDNKHVAFKIQDPKTKLGRLMEMDITTGKVRTLSSPNEDVLYHSYKPDGTVMYTRRPKNAPKPLGEHGELVMMDISHFDTQNAENLETRKALGYLWGDACNTKLDMDSAEAVGTRLLPENCQALVESADIEKVKVRIHSGEDLSKETLMAECKALGNSKYQKTEDVR